MSTEKKTTLTSIDFMMMDVHRELDEGMIDQEMMVDKTANHDPGPAIGERCDVCFAPMPCDEHKNVEQLNVLTTHDISPTSIIADAHNAGLKEVVIVGMLDDGTEYFASSIADGGTSMYYLQRGIHKLNHIIDGDYENEHLGPRPAA